MFRLVICAFGLVGFLNHSLGNIPDLQKRRIQLVAAKDSQGRIYAIGGDIDDKTGRRASVATIERYTPGAAQWEVLGQFHTERAAFAAGLHDGRIYIFGGVDSKNRRLGTVEVFDTRTNQSRVVDVRIVPRWSFAAVYHDNRFLLIGGDNSRQVPFTSPSPAYPISSISQMFRGTGVTEQYLIQHETASLVNSRLNVRRYGHVALKANNKVFVFGGRLTGPLAGETMSVGLLHIPRLAYLTEGLNLNTHRWVPFDSKNVSSFPFHSLKVGRVGLSAAKTTNGKLLAIGGAQAANIQRDIPLEKVESFNPATGQWTNKANLPRPRSYGAAVTLNDGTVAVLGGIGPRTEANYFGTRTVFEYNPQTDTWTE